MEFSINCATFTCPGGETNIVTWVAETQHCCLPISTRMQGCCLPTSTGSTTTTKSSHTSATLSTSSSFSKPPSTSSNPISPSTTSSQEPINTTFHSTTSPTTPFPTTTHAARTVSTGAVVGVGVGCAVIGSLLTGLALFLLSHWKRQQPPRWHLPIIGRAYDGQRKYSITTTNAPVQRDLITNVDHLLPQPAEDDAIIGELSKIRDGIKYHAQNYYHNAPVKHGMVDDTRLVELANATTMPPVALRNLLLNPMTRAPTIQLFLAQFILSRCAGRTDSQLSFLPGEVSNLATFPIGTNMATASQGALFSKLKTISGALLRQQYGHQPDANDACRDSITQALAEAEAILQPFIDPSIDMNAYRHNLESIMKRAARFAFLLFSQPGLFRFDYTGTGQADSLLVFPAFLQTANNEAEPLSPSRVLSKGEVLNKMEVLPELGTYI